MSASTGAVFLSYASQDAAAAQRICEALRNSGIEVWFDQSELRGGDVWDQKIRHEIQDCALFIPIISQHTQERLEGYFRHEWKLAIERAHHMAEQKAFLVPVVVDSTRDQDALVPDAFRAVQWTRLPGGETPPTFIQRVRKLLSPNGPAKSRALPDSASAVTPAAEGRTFAPGRRAVLLAIATAGIVTIGYLGRERLMRSKPPVPLGTAKSIAILPLANESGDANQQYFSDGISEDLITALSQFPGLKVIGRTSAFQFRDSKEDSRSIGAKLGVAHLLEGSVRRSGEVVRISAELIDTADGSTQWSERYDRPYKDLFALQDEITRAVAGALRAKLLAGEHSEAQSERPPSGSLEAYNALLQGRFYLTFPSEADCRNAIDQFSTATRLDPGYALAWAELARAWMLLSYAYLSGAPAQEAYAKARTAVDRALALSPALALAHEERASMFSGVEFDQQRALTEFRRAVQLAPDNAYVRRALGRQLAVMGEVEQGVELMREALATDPLNTFYMNELQEWLAVLGRLDDAERIVRKLMELAPGSQRAFADLSYIEILRGNAGAALAAAELEPPGPFRAAALAQAWQIGTDRAAADAALKALIDGVSDRSAYQIAKVYALRNDREKTFEWLERAWRNRDPGLTNLLVDPFFKRFRTDPRFADLCRKVGLPVPSEPRHTN